MTNLVKTAARIGFTATLLLLTGTLAAEALDNGTGPGSGSNCEQTAKDDFNSNVNYCNNVLSDLPGQLAQCISDAKEDLDRALAACRSGSTSALSHGMGNISVQGGFNGNGGGNNGSGKNGKFGGLKVSQGKTFSLRNN